MAYTNLQSAYLFHRRNGKARATRALELAKLDIEAGKRRHSRQIGASVVNPVIPAERARGWKQCRWIEDCDAIGLRHVGYSDEILSLRHTGWFSDAFQDESYRGEVWQLPARNGQPLFVYGYSDPCNAGAALICFDLERGDNGEDEDAKRDAARHGDSMAEAFAEVEREYSEAWQKARQWEEAQEDMAKIRANARQLVKDMRAAIRAGQSAADSICAALRSQLASLGQQWEAARQERDNADSEFWFYKDGKSVAIAEFAKANL